MPLNVGNLQADPEAQSFISVEDADAYLLPEGNAIWADLTPDQKSAALVRASRWLAGAFRFYPLSEVDLIRVGHAAARVASVTFSVGVFDPVDTSQIVVREKVGPIDVTYASGMATDIGSLRLPWLQTMLWGLILPEHTSIGIMVI